MQQNKNRIIMQHNKSRQLIFMIEHTFGKPFLKAQTSV